MATTLRVTTAEPTAEPTGHGHVVHADHTPAAPGVTDLLLLLMALIWGVNYIVAKFGTQAFAPLAFNAARIALATAVLWSIVFARGDALPTRRDATASTRSFLWRGSPGRARVTRRSCLRPPRRSWRSSDGCAASSGCPRAA
jgi:hypothetical protein